MSRIIKINRKALGAMLIIGLCGLLVSTVKGQDEPAAPAAAFEDLVDLSAFGTIAVHSQGRVKSFDSFATGMMQFVMGSRQIDGQSSSFTYLDLMLRPERYVGRDVVFIKMKQIRAQIVQSLQAAGGAQAIDDFEARMQRFIETGLLSEELLLSEPVQALLQRLRTDLVRTASKVQEIDTAIQVKNPGTLHRSLTVVPPPGGDVNDFWLTFEDLSVSLAHAHEDAELNPQLHQQLTTQWSSFITSWRQSDAAGVNAAATQLVTLLPLINPELYPQQSRLSWESWYFRARNMTWVWIIYLFSVIPLLASMVYRWPSARWMGISLFIVAFAFHTFATMLRWYVAERWPNSNMFEAITTAAWFGGCFALVMELIVRRTPMRNLFFLGSAVASMVAVMATRLFPLSLNANIGNMMPVLHDIWLYIHTNIIIFSYCLIFLASVSGGLYLLRRIWMALRGQPGSGEYAHVGGAASLMMTRPDGTKYLAGPRTTFGQVLDGSTMILMELSFILLWTGLVMGAIWADHSWGRPWGWDPKEVFALNTFLVFALLVHVRIKVKDKGLWTAILAVIGCGVMLFNWIIINFAITGLHSYA